MKRSPAITLAAIAVVVVTACSAGEETGAPQTSPPSVEPTPAPTASPAVTAPLTPTAGAATVEAEPTPFVALAPDGGGLRVPYHRLNPIESPGEALQGRWAIADLEPVDGSLCLYVRRGQGPRYLIVWPPGGQLDVSDGRIDFVLDGRSVAKPVGGPGDRVTLGGDGNVNTTSNALTYDPDLAGCDAEYVWFAF